MQPKLSHHLLQLHTLNHLEERDRILKDFYDNFLQVIFPHADQLDSLEVIQEGLLKGDHETPHSFLRVDVLFEGERMCGGVVYEFYQHSACGLISYFCVDKLDRAKGLGSLLVNSASREIHSVARSCGFDHANAIFMETNKARGPNHGEESSHTRRYELFDRLGFKRVKFPFVQPPLGEGKNPSDTLYLTVCTEQPNSLQMIDGQWKMPAALLEKWMKEYWCSVKDDMESTQDFKKMAAFFKGQEYLDIIPLLNRANL